LNVYERGNDRFVVFFALKAVGLKANHVELTKAKPIPFSLFLAISLKKGKKKI